MRYLATVALTVVVIVGCDPGHSHNEDERGDEISLYSEHEGLTLPEDMQRELNVQVAAIGDTNAVPESAIIRGAKEDFTYVKEGKNYVRTLLGELTPGAIVVTNGVKDLWMIELLAIRGGEPCCR